MADITEADHFNNITEMLKDATVLRTQVQSLDKKIKDLKELKNIDEASDHCKKFDQVATTEILQSGLEDLQTRVDELLNKLSVTSDSTGDEVAVFKNSLKGLNREERSLSFRFGRLAKNLKKPNARNSLEVEEDYGGEEGEEQEEIVVSGRAMLSKKLKIMKYYYHYLFVLSSADDFLTNIPELKEELRGSACRTTEFIGNVEESHEESESDSESMFKRGSEEKYLPLMGYSDSKLEVKNFEDLKGKIPELMLARSITIEEERTEGEKKSFMEKLMELRGKDHDGDDESSFEGIWKSSLDEIEFMSIQVGILLSLCCTDFLFIVSENEDAIRLYQKCFKCLLKLLIDEKEEWSGVSIKKVLSVLRFAEGELAKMGKLEQNILDDHDRETADDNDNNQEVIPSPEVEIDRVLDMLLREVLCLESVLSYPTLSDVQVNDKSLLNWQLSNLKEILEEGKREMEKIGLKVDYLKAVQCEQIEDGTDLTMTKFQDVMRARIVETWHQLDLDKFRDDQSN